MKNKGLYIILSLFAILAISAALWQAHEAVNLEKKLTKIDNEAQVQRLVEQSIPRIEQRAQEILMVEELKLKLAGTLAHNFSPERYKNANIAQNKKTPAPRGLAMPRPMQRDHVPQPEMAAPTAIAIPELALTAPSAPLPSVCFDSDETLPPIAQNSRWRQSANHISEDAPLTVGRAVATAKIDDIGYAEGSRMNSLTYLSKDEPLLATAVNVSAAQKSLEVEFEDDAKEELQAEEEETKEDETLSEPAPTPAKEFTENPVEEPFVSGHFLLNPPGSPGGIETPKGDELLRAQLSNDPSAMNSLIHKAANPSAPLHDPHGKSDYRPGQNIAVMAVYDVPCDDYSQPVLAKGDLGVFFTWNDNTRIYHMRSLRTTHGHAAEGVVFNAEALAKELMKVVDPALKGAEISLAMPGEKASIASFPLVLHPGQEMLLSDMPARRQALSGTVNSAWVICFCSVALIVALFSLYARLERRRSDFVSAVTHELRTPLTSFKLYTEMLKEGLVPKDKLPGYYENLHQESQRLAHLVENVLAFSRLSRGKMRGRQDCGPCGQMLPPVFERIEQHLKKAGFEFNYTMDTRCHHVQLKTDLVSLEQVLTNLSDNSIKYGAGEKPSVNIQLVQTHRDLLIRFSDTGPGIAEDIAKKLFRPFSRSAEAGQGRKPGIGLGLALSRDLARSIGGDLALEKSNERGTSFLITLPLGA